MVVLGVGGFFFFAFVCLRQRIKIWYTVACACVFKKNILLLYNFIDGFISRAAYTSFCWCIEFVCYSLPPQCFCYFFSLYLFICSLFYVFSLPFISLNTHCVLLVFFLFAIYVLHFNCYKHKKYIRKNKKKQQRKNLQIAKMELTCACSMFHVYVYLFLG